MNITARAVFAIVLMLLASCAAQTPAASLTPDAVLTRFRDAGLNVANVTTADVLTAEVANAAPSCQGARFDVEGDSGARVIVCGEERHAEAVATYYTSLGESNPMFFSHVERRGQLVLQMNGSLPADLFQQYVTALPGA